jgi:hypothetical protein
MSGRLRRLARRAGAVFLAVFTLRRWQARILYVVAFAAVVLVGVSAGNYLLELAGIR